MSFDVFLQGFRRGDAADGEGAAVMRVLSPHIAERSEHWARLVIDDGDAEVFGIADPETGLLFNHVSGRLMWSVIVDVARAAGFVVMPIGCPRRVRSRRRE